FSVAATATKGSRSLTITDMPYSQELDCRPNRALSDELFYILATKADQSAALSLPEPQDRQHPSGGGVVDSRGFHTEESCDLLRRKQLWLAHVFLLRTNGRQCPSPLGRGLVWRFGC